MSKDCLKARAIAAAENDELAADWRKEPAQYAPVIRELVARVAELERALSQVLIHNDGEALKQAEQVMARQCMHQIQEPKAMTHTSTEQPDALRLADIVERLNVGVHSQAIAEEYSAAARELRRLHARIAELEDELQAARRAQVVPQGWRLVPEDPSLEMQQAALKYVSRQHQTRDAYAEMLAAAPQPPEAECITCSGHGAVGNITNAEPCPDCTHPCSLMSEKRTSKPEAAPVVPQFSKVAKKKLDYLLEAGEEITGYAIQNKDGRRGAIDCHGFVYWWQDAAPVQMPDAKVYWIEAGEQFCIKRGEKRPFSKAWAPLYTEQQVRDLLARKG